MDQIQLAPFFQIKFYWNTDVPIHLRIDCFGASKAELSSCDTKHMACEDKDIYYLPFYRK